jgi:hypothetical protein
VPKKNKISQDPKKKKDNLTAISLFFFPLQKIFSKGFLKINFRVSKKITITMSMQFC